MLDMGFIDPIRRTSRPAAKRQNLMFSRRCRRNRSWPHHILVDPVNVAVTPLSSTVELITKWVLHVDRGDKRSFCATFGTRR
jgi:ATP-dependent RNA helicase RhlE